MARVKALRALRQPETRGSCIIDARDVAQVLSARLRLLKSASGLSLREIEWRTGMSSGTVGQIMRGEQPANLPQLIELQHVFELHSLEELLGPIPSSTIPVGRQLTAELA